MGGRFLDASVQSLELCTAEDVAAADNQADLAAAIGGLLDLAGDLRDFLHADAAFAGVTETFAGEFQNDSGRPRRRCCVRIRGSGFGVQRHPNAPYLVLSTEY